MVGSWMCIFELWIIYLIIYYYGIISRDNRSLIKKSRDNGNVIKILGDFFLFCLNYIKLIIFKFIYILIIIVIKFINLEL